MALAKTVVDTNIFMDFLMEREPFYRDARLLMLAANVGEVEVWLCASQVTDLIYVLSEGGKSSLIPRVLERMRMLRSFVQIASVDAWCTDRMLATAWNDPEDALVHEVALQLKADCIITRDAYLQQQATIPAFDCAGFFTWLERTAGISYEEVSV